MITIFDLLEKRYAVVRQAFEAAFPGEPPPELPAPIVDLRDVINVIDQMLSKLNGQAVILVKDGPPWASTKHDA